MLPDNYLTSIIRKERRLLLRLPVFILAYFFYGRQ